MRLTARPAESEPSYSKSRGSTAREFDVIRVEFAGCTIVLGGNRRHILRKHLLPFLKPRFVVLFLREAIQVLILLSHLGILGIFFGGGAPFSASLKWSFASLRRFLMSSFAGIGVY